MRSFTSLVIFGAVYSVSSVAFGETSTVAKSHRVDVSGFPPCVIVGSGAKPTGFDIALMDAIGQELGFTFAYHDVGPFERIFDGVRTGTAAFAVAGISITADREALMDFSKHYLDSGLHILIRDDGSSSVLFAIETLLHAPILWIFFGSVFLLANVMWLAERGKGGVHERYFPGIFDAGYWAITTVSTVGYGDITPKHTIGRITAVILMFWGIATFAMLTAELTATLAVRRIATDIRGPEDLHGKRVATVHGTTSEGALERLGARTNQVDRIEDAYALLERQEVDAVVYDAPAILGFATGEGQGWATVVGPLFERQYYGIAMPEGSPHREAIDRALLKLRENGTYDRLHREWFGK